MQPGERTASSDQPGIAQASSSASQGSDQEGDDGIGGAGRPNPPRGPAWLIGIVVATFSGLVFFCAVMGLAVAPAFGESVPPPPALDVTRPDIKILVEESYISEMLSQALPEGLEGSATLDVQPGNRLVVTAKLNLIVVNLDVVVNAGIGAEDGQVRVWVDSVETGGYDIFQLIGIGQVDLGEDITDTIQRELEAQLGPGSHLMNITTDEEQIILTARWE